MKTDIKEIFEKIVSDWHVNRDLSFEVFVMFSRFEYALKRAGYASVQNNYIKVDWDRFAIEHKDLIKSTNLSNEIRYFKKSPPNKQSYDGQTLKWKIQKWDSKQSDLHELLRFIYNVRNNLFHGGKFPGQPISDVSRDNELLKHVIAVIQECININNTVRYFFCDTK